ncbi:hypothetical protein HNY73_011196 [Argiope bruennichi]|uniref:Uncharacterized protein n=1 Tax=Argiope bruennichi TaxID=94029 RepID=A0A8T0F9L8_ARGBR|nr:hypothetical protein HNY73_011196 [Argiope bruennichi]
MEGDGRSERDVSSNASMRSHYKLRSELHSALCARCEEIQKSEKMWEFYNGNMERSANPANVKVLQKNRDAATERLKELGPCILPKCRTHTENNSDICAHLVACQEGIKRNREILNTCNDTLQLMSNNNQEHTIQFLDDLRANELKAKIEDLKMISNILCPVE